MPKAYTVVTYRSISDPVELDVAGTRITASITNEAADELKLVAGHTAYAVIKARDVMVGID
jgi:molybdopterin-binding protein